MAQEGRARHHTEYPSPILGTRMRGENQLPQVVLTDTALPPSNKYILYLPTSDVNQRCTKTSLFKTQGTWVGKILAIMSTSYSSTTLVQFPAPMSGVSTTDCNSSFKDSNTLFKPLWAGHIHMRHNNTSTHTH